MFCRDEPSQPDSGDALIVGVVGDMGPESTLLYYRMLIEENRRLNPGCGELPIVVTSVDGVTVLARLQVGDLAEVARLLSVELERLNQVGAAFAMLGSNSVHVIFDELQELVDRARA